MFLSLHGIMGTAQQSSYLLGCAVTFLSKWPVHKALFTQFLAVHFAVGIKPFCQHVYAGHNSSKNRLKPNPSAVWPHADGPCTNLRRCLQLGLIELRFRVYVRRLESVCVRAAPVSCSKAYICLYKIVVTHLYC